MQATTTPPDAIVCHEGVPASSVRETNNRTIYGDKNKFPSILKGRRLLLATESLGPVNGVSRTTSSLISYLRENGVQVAIVAPQFNDRNFKSNGSITPDVHLQGYSLPYNPDLTVVYPFRFDQICRRTFEPEIVYLASPASLGFQILLQIRQFTKAPVILLNFQTDLSSYSDILFPKPMARFAVWLLAVVQGFLFKHHTVHTIFFPSFGIHKYLEGIGIPNDKLVHLGRGVDTVLFNPSHRDTNFRKRISPNGEIILVCVGRLAPEKGFEFLAKVMAKLIQEGLPLKLMIVGGNRNPSVEEEIHKLFNEVKDHVVFTGFLTGAPLARVYASGDIFLHSSITETFGLVVLEAMASGLPVIARDQGGPSEIVQNRKTGYLVPPDDVDSFVLLVQQLCNDVGLRSNMAVASQKVANDTTWEKINRQVAWGIADGLTQHPQDEQTERHGKTIANWLLSRYRESMIGLILPALVTLRLYLAIGVIYFIWIIAVIPLIIHGSSAFPRDWWASARGVILPAASYTPSSYQISTKDRFVEEISQIRKFRS